MKKSLSLLTVAIALGLDSAPAFAVINASEPGDANLTCKQLVQQIQAMDAAIAEAESSQTKSKIAGAGLGILQSAIPHLGVGGGTITAMQATGAAANVAGGSVQSADETIKQAQMRRTSLIGIHTGKACKNSYAAPATTTNN